MQIIDHPSPNFGPRPTDTPIDMLVLHYTGMKSAVEALSRMCDPAAEVSAHYLIDEDGAVYHLVEEGARAWHAGISMWQGRSDLNDRSIGIELQNPGHEFGYRDFPAAQMAALIQLSADIVSRNSIPAGHVVGHSDIAPGRKMDPGERFDWQALAGGGVGMWPSDNARAGAADAEDTADQLMAELGYDTRDRAAAIAAFQRHFRPALIDGKADAETLALMAALLSTAS
ncbi:MAG: N-acetylmuramoyl-L-alanine amidase [Rhodospirillales bacterium]|nr:N-acetylmuramoyl-L-alanine amidase [Rhodospirillales bacterium]